MLGMRDYITPAFTYAVLLQRESASSSEMLTVLEMRGPDNTRRRAMRILPVVPSLFFSQLFTISLFRFYKIILLISPKESLICLTSIERISSCMQSHEFILRKS